MQTLSINTQAILLLTAPLIAGRGTLPADILSPGEYKRLARKLREMKRQPADLLSPDSADLLRACQLDIDESRLQRLLERGFLLSQVIEYWQARAIWVISRADANYPRYLKARLREDAPAVLYGCGDFGLMDTGGLAVVGSRNVEQTLIDFTMDVGRLAANAGKTIVSGGARGIDQAAMLGALNAGGKVTGVLADSLEKTAMNREQRNFIINGQLLLISPYDPSAGFNVGNAMQRNKLIYALADAALVVSSDHKKGGTWAGATEQLDKLRLVPVFVRLTGEISTGMEALRKKGASPWPNPQDVGAFKTVFDVVKPSSSQPPIVRQVGFSLFLNEETSSSVLNETPPEIHAPRSMQEKAKKPTIPDAVLKDQQVSRKIDETRAVSQTPEPQSERYDTAMRAELSPAEAIFAVVSESIQRLLEAPKKDTEIAVALDVSTAQAKVWLHRLVEENLIIKSGKPVTYQLNPQKAILSK